MTPEQLQLPYRHYQPAEQRPDADEPVINWVIGDTYGHYEGHRLWIEQALAARGWPLAEDEALPTTVLDLQVRIAAEWTMLADALGDLAAADITTDRGEGWNLGDHLAHVAAWELGISGLLSGASRWRSMGIEPADLAEQNVDTINAAVLDLHRGKPAPEVIALRERAHRRLLDVIAGLRDADLSRPYRDFDPEESRFPTDGPVVIWIAADTYQHYRDHRRWLARLS
ncbi:MAG: ClbS/DfsB family four-helix bundle protein [Oscillochloris sp.]|nr:ClbS/DfsB family four-helix bundle protein [Oscillochloris sp.]